jgi:CYTH domain-containing protein
MTDPAGKYARFEVERRFLVGTPPPLGADGRRIVDRYLDGTRLRLRRMERLDGSETLLKLGQKLATGDPERVALTNVYLSEAEHAVLAALPAAELRKTRYRVDPFVVDVFEGRHAGLVLAEADPRELAGPLPDWIVRDVTDDDRYTGGALARVDATPPAS